jgi:hypothetical protein
MMKTKDSFTRVLKFTLMNIFWVFRTFSCLLQKPQKITISFIAVLFLPAWFCLPAFSLPTLDLTTAGSSGYIGDAYFMQVDPQPTGSGYIHSFVRVSTNQDVEQGYNTDARPLEFDENSSPEFTRALLVDDVPIYNLDGTAYRGFLLDINQTKSDSYLSLDGLEIFLADEGDRSGYPSNLGTKIYDLDADGDNWIKLDYALNHGSGTGDMMAYIPDNLFTGGSYIYLYSIFGQSEDSAFPNNDGYEEWATIPSPTALILGCIGISCTGWLRRRNFA